ncbi:hypothetical protein CFII64_03047 [Pseudomonas sp. CFII64]|nr:hypothetical protein CFII64_03047 [Pseudomonas sp. CFII64]
MKKSSNSAAFARSAISQINSLHPDNELAGMK